jgi:methionyl-tRNA formyltransferase
MNLVMMGTGAFAEPTFERLLQGPHPVVGLVTQPDRPGGSERGSTRQVGRGMAAIAREHHIPVIQPLNINTPEGAAALRELKPDLLVVAAYGQILSDEILRVPSQGGINVHASLLPRYRGAAPVAWAIHQGETRTGVTVIKMSVSLDAGDMLAQEAIDIGPEETAGELEARLAQLGARLALQVVDQIVADTAQGIKQDKSLATKAPKLTKEHGLIDWDRPAAAVGNQVRAMQPWPTAYTFLHCPDHRPVRVIVYRARAASQPSDPAAVAGSLIIPPLALSLFVAAGRHNSGERSVVEVIELQPAGKKRMTAAEFLRGHAVQPGSHFGAEAP